MQRHQKIRMRPRILPTAFVATMLAFGTAFGQHVNESEPRPGEQRLNRFQYHASHNSFQRGTAPDFISLSSQVDTWGVRQVELDVYYEQSPSRFVVEHNCCDFDGGGLLDDYLADLGSSVAVARSFVFLNFQLHPTTSSGNCEDCFVDFPSNWETLLRDKIELYFDPGSIYTWGDFVQDNKQWPSMQELLRRGKHLAVQGVNYDNPPSTLFFFGGQADEDGTLDPQTLVDTNKVQINSPGLDPVDHPWDLGDRFFSRDYPGGQLTCPVEPDADWDDAVGAGFTMLATNCVTDVDKIGDYRIHPPLPTYVVPFDTENDSLGTVGRPYAGTFGLNAAIARIRAHEADKGVSNVTIALWGDSEYQSFGALGQSPPFMTLTTQGGPITITN